MTIEDALKQLPDKLKNTTQEQLKTYSNKLLEDTIKLQPIKTNG